MRVETHDDAPLPPEYEWLIGPKMGIVQRLILWYPERTGPQLYTSGSSEADIGTLREGDSPDMLAGGKGLNARDALRSAVGETVERYALRWPDESRLERATYEDLETQASVVDFEYVDILPQRRDAYTRPIFEDTSLLWTPGTNLLSGEETYVPSQLVWSQTGPLAEEPRYFAGTTNGAAAGESLQDAILGGLYELIERDGFMTTWLSQSPPRRIDPDEVPGLQDRIDELFPTDELSVHVFAFESLVDVPAYGAALVNERDEYPKFLIGGAAGPDPRETIEDALVEVGQGWIYVNELPTDGGRESIDTDEVIWNFDDNVQLYGYPENFDDVKFLLEGDATGIRQEPIEGPELPACLDRLEAADCTPVAVDVTTPDVASAGIRTTQVLVPEFVPLVPPSVVPERHPRIKSMDPPDVPHPYP